MAASIFAFAASILASAAFRVAFKIMRKIVRKPRRSVLYVPGSNAKALKKSSTLDVDALIYDLEDSVALSAKEDARKAIINIFLASILSLGISFKIIFILIIIIFTLSASIFIFEIPLDFFNYRFHSQALSPF